eukprot:CAMPEP_0201484048 /NCGR_PEP_ID=MMETSP0151_2-20130828/8236_1 /ASSEMBLY_ACC=CAM_ASM_000257 /TAXON_ID=200890 /ORGANISM="Paramoeba atlantica, Strain 621/1 / CCAP 1560/9" /LENGTH=366 /DNA_ID=CAMNT_0047867499 /DNA_START=258 /DNA_END=1359 /DNA_ORIENTATION=-
MPFPPQTRKRKRKTLLLHSSSPNLNEARNIREYVLHYLGRGAEHVFILDDGSTDHFERSLECVDSKFYTIIYRHSREAVENVTSKWRKEHSPPFYRYTGQNILGAFGGYYLFLRLYGQCSEWVGMFDADEFLVSRKYPQLSIPEVLKKDFSSCSVVSTPWLRYAYGKQEHDPVDHTRSALQYRWSFDAEFQKDLNPPVPREMRRQFHHVGGNINETISSKMIVRMSDLCFMGNVHCAAMVRGNSCTTFGEIENVCNKSTTDIMHMIDCGEYCKFASIANAGRSQIKEKDIPNMAFALHHYRIQSMDHLLRKEFAKPEKYANLSHYHDMLETYANRPDIFDPFITETQLVDENDFIARRPCSLPNSS